jgi:hypothetical protein
VTKPTHGEPNRHDDALVDSALAAAMRTHAREEPPAALDAAILAAAHRAVGARPGVADNVLAEAREPQRWWWPLAAAAAIGAIALGVIQLWQPQRSDVDAIVSDAPVGQVASPRPPAPSSAREDAIPSQLEARSGVASVPATPEAQKAAAAPAEPAPRLAQSVSPEAKQPALQLRDQAKTASPSAPPAPSPRANHNEMPPAPDLARVRPGPASQGAPAAAQPVPAPVPQRQAMPFPGQQRAIDAPPPAAAPLNERAGSSTAGGVSGADVRERDPTLRKFESASEPAKPQRDAQAPPAAALTAPATGARLQSRSATAAEPPRSVDEWIVHLRQLRREGREAEARAALASFRAAHADADARLPPDLGEWAALVKP